MTSNPHSSLVQLPSDKVAELLRDDLDYLAAALIPDVAESPFPPFYKQVWAYILYSLHTLPIHDIFRFALGLPRGHAKTTFIKLLVCYLIIHDYDIDFIQVVCSTEPLAENFLTDVHNMMQSPLITQLYGSWTQSLTRDTMKVKKANWQGRKLILVAIGAGTSTRGLNLDNRRPNLIICDDAQTKENDESETDRTKLLLWLVGTLFKSLTKTKRKAILYIGNMYSEECILYTFSKLRQWTSLVTGGILADGSALWPAIQTVDEMLAEYEHDSAVGLGAVWFAEIQNDPVGASAGLLDPGEIIHSCPQEEYQDVDLYPQRFITVDPAGFRNTSDDNVVGVHCMMEEGKAATITVDGGKWKPTTVIERALTLAIEWRVGIIFVESNAYQGTLAFWMEKTIRENELDIKVIPMATGTASKFKRIKAWVKQLAGGKWQILERKAYTKLTFQIYKYRTNKKDNSDDYIDVCAQAVLAINKHGRDIINAVAAEPTEKPQTPSLAVVDNSRIRAIRQASRRAPQSSYYG